MTGLKIKERGWPGQFRLVGAMSLAIAFFLPVSSCSSSFTGIHESTQVASVDAEPDAVDGVDGRYRYPFKMLALDNPKSPLIVLTYFWSAVALSYRKFSRNRAGRKFTYLELFLCFLTIYMVSTLAFLERLEIGGYLAFFGIALYLVATSSLLMNEIKQQERS